MKPIKLIFDITFSNERAIQPQHCIESIQSKLGFLNKEIRSTDRIENKKKRLQIKPRTIVLENHMIIV